MSTKCKYSHLLPLFLDGGMSNSEHDDFTSHLDECKDCSESLNGLTSIEQMLEQYNRQEPLVEILYAYQTRLAKHFPITNRFVAAWRRISNSWNWIWDYHPRMMTIARASAFVFIGVLIGRFVFYTPVNEPEMLASNAEIMILAPDSKDVHLVNEFFTQSEILLLAIKHTDENSSAQQTSDLKFEKQLAQNLLFKSQQLQENMIVLQDQELKAFLEKLELVLLEISNTEDSEIRYIFTELKKIINNTKMVNQSKQIQKKIEKLI